MFREIFKFDQGFNSDLRVPLEPGILRQWELRSRFRYEPHCVKAGLNILLSTRLPRPLPYHTPSAFLIARSAENSSKNINTLPESVFD